MSDRWRLLALPPLPHATLLSLFGDDRLELVTPSERTQDEVDRLLPDADLVLGDWTPRLRLTGPGPRACFVQQPSVGVDGITLEPFTAAGVPVANCPGANTTSVAEWVVSAALALLRKTVAGDEAVRRGEWPQTSLGARELAGQAVGVVGMGAVGRRTAELFAAFGCDVSYWSRSRHDDAPVPYAELDDLLAGSDVVALVIALGDETRGLLSQERLQAMKPGAMLLNAARGQVVDEPALARALASGHLGGAALDVFTTEPLPADSPLRTTGNVLLSPHLAGSSDRAVSRILALSQANLQRVLAGEPVVDLVNDADPAVRRRHGSGAEPDTEATRTR